MGGPYSRAADYHMGGVIFLLPLAFQFGILVLGLS
jgi:hypothetical protein